MLVIKNPQHLRPVNHFLGGRHDILTFTLPLFTECKKMKGENANEKIHSNWAHNTSGAPWSVIVITCWGVSNQKGVFWLRTSIAATWIYAGAGGRGGLQITFEGFIEAEAQPHSSIIGGGNGSTPSSQDQNSKSSPESGMLLPLPGHLV